MVVVFNKKCAITKNLNEFTNLDNQDKELLKKERQKYTDKILNSPSPKKLIIVGPGTGKTYIFKTLLRKIKKESGEEGLAVTFIRNLVADLKIDLAGLAKVSTFHAFCKSRLHPIRNEEFEYYPDLFKIIGEDFEFLGEKSLDEEKIERCFYGIKDEKVIDSTLKIGDYYNASGHSDAVYRVIKYFEAHSNHIPSYPLIVVDEYQDFNYLETSLIEILSRQSPVLIVGDDDQALYAFKQASVKYIRRLTQNPDFQRFELPYCSRCPKVIVDAVNEIVKIAIEKGRLNNRVNKLFKYFSPEKEVDSKHHPNIFNVCCSVERKNCHYMGRFIANEISQIPKVYIRESKKRREPTVLIIGPGQFLRGIRKELKNRLEYFSEEKSTKDEAINIIDGYKLLAKNKNSRLGWRIILHCDPCDNSDKVIKKALSERVDLNPFIQSKQYIAKHMELADLTSKIIVNEELNIFKQTSIEEAINLSLEEIRAYLQIEEDDDFGTQEIFPDEEDAKPDILCTSFEGSKGLAAQYVFIVGVNENHFPQKVPPSDRDICRLIVALTRTRKRCYVISCNRFGEEQLAPSVFLTWLKNKCGEQIYVNKKYVDEFCN